MNKHKIKKLCKLAIVTSVVATLVGIRLEKTSNKIDKSKSNIGRSVDDILNLKQI